MRKSAISLVAFSALIFSTYGCASTASLSHRDTPQRGATPYVQVAQGYGKIPQGIFKFDGREHIYYSNGQGHYCYYDSWDHFVQLTGNPGFRTQPGKLSQYNMVFDGICTGTSQSKPAPHPDPYF
jgi:hypothetical protein